MAATRDAIGARGEAILTLLLTGFHGRSEPLFRPHFMGDRYPTIDFFVELVDAGRNLTPFFLAQVKTTRQGYTKQEPHRLKISVDRAAMDRLKAYPAPTYVIGVDEVAEVGSIMAAVVGGPTHSSSLPTTYPLADPATPRALYDEVLTFWETHATTGAGSRFV